jgi:hypothetical protein
MGHSSNKLVVVLPLSSMKKSFEFRQLTLGQWPIFLLKTNFLAVKFSATVDFDSRTQGSYSGMVSNYLMRDPVLITQNSIHGLNKTFAT